ncbi:MAG TPA: ABC transporter permease [Catalimonadaceae bacterium]|nr:ABC transporter permease [Catalimonadaceae bacterium]HPI11097.1 ABC transporter permease [Catalimonadaceae bacterium]
MIAQLANRPVLRIAMVHLISKKRQTAVAMLGVMFGITVFIFQAGLITGLQIFMLDKIVNNSPHVHLYNEPEKNPPSILSKIYHEDNQMVVVRNQKQKEIDKKIRNSSGIMEIIQKMPGVLGVAPNVATQAIVKAGVKQIPVTISGVEIEKEDALFNIHKDQIAGDIRRLDIINNGVILGKGVADKLGATIDDIITVSTTLSTIDMKVVSITSTGITSIDDNRAMVNLRIAQKLMNRDKLYITDINLKLKNVDKADEMSEDLTRLFGLKAQSWKEANANVFSVFKIQNIATYLVITSILIVAGFGIFNILMMMIYEKMTDIAVLKSIGYKNRDIRNIFMVEAVVIGFTGGLLGLAHGWLASFIASKIEVKLAGLVTLDHLSINFDPMFYLAGFAFALVTTALAGYFPALKASKVDPVDIIRGH